MFFRTKYFVGNLETVFFRTYICSAGRKQQPSAGSIKKMTEETVTIAELAEAYGRKADTLYRKAGRAWPGRKWSKHSVVTEQEARILLGDWPAPVPAKEKVRAEKPASEKHPTPARQKPTPAPRFKLPTFHTARRATISALLFAVVVLHGLLIWYDCSVLWDVPGQIGGGAVFVVVLAALLLASDNTLPRTSGNALAFMAVVDGAAWKVHYEVFKTPLVENLITGSLCAFICASSFVALWLFRDSKLD